MAVSRRRPVLPAASALTALLAQVNAGVALTVAAVNAVADPLLDRDMGAGVDTGSSVKRTVCDALRSARNSWYVVGTTC